MLLHHRILLVIFFAMASFVAQANEQHYLESSTNVAQRLLTAMNDHDYQKLRQFVSSTIAPQTLKRLPVERYAGYLAAEISFHGELQYHSTKFVGLNDGIIESHILVQSKNTELWYRIELFITQGKPYKITRIRLRANSSPLNEYHSPSISAAVSDFSDYLDRLSERQLFSGTVLVAKGNDILLTKAAGLASKRFNVANNIDTRFNIGSMNKMFTSVTILKLIAEGKLTLFTPVEKVLAINGKAEHFKDIQIQHLLSHTSGIGGFHCEQGEDSIAKSLTQCLAKVSEVQVNFKPGSNYRYSNDGMFVLGLVIEKLTGDSYYQAIQTAVFDVAQMHNTACLDLQYPVANAAIGYSYDGSSAQWRNNLFVHDKKGGPAGGCYSTVGDFYKFAQAMKAHKLLDAPMTELAWTAKSNFNANNYGFGFIIREQHGEQVVGHNGSFIGVSAQMDIHLDSGYTIIVLANHSFAADPVIAKFNSLFNLN